MSKWIIDKQFSFCYGHRVWSQALFTSFCEKNDTQAKCRHLHGHEGLVHVFLEGDTLTNGMVTDFKHLGWLKNFLDDTLDHKFVIDVNDPLFDTIVLKQYFKLFPNRQSDASRDLVFNDMYKRVVVPGTNAIACYELNMEGADEAVANLRDGMDASEAQAIKEQLDGYTIVDFVPTSENLSKWVYDVANERMRELGVEVVRVDWFETPKSRSTYMK